MQKQQETFSTKIGFILACLGAAIGLGNIWLFPWRLGAYGGASFLIPYIIFSFTLAKAGMTIEIALGRFMKKSPYSAVHTILEKKNVPFKKAISLIPTLSIIGIFLFYSIVFGWILKYFILSLGFKLGSMDTISTFNATAGTTGSIIWHGLAVLLTAIVVILGVQNGIEKLNKIVMPALFIGFSILAIVSLSLDNAIEGVKYVFLPRWDALFNLETWVMALGQAFFSTSLTGAGLVLYGSYLKDDVDIVDATNKTIIFNIISALLSTLVIMPAVFSFGLDPQAGPSLLFITLPEIFKRMASGSIFSILFFLTVVFAAISSAINMLDCSASLLTSKLNFSRKKATILLAIILFILGIPMDLNMNIFGKFSDFITIILAPLGALIAMIAFIWLTPSKKAFKEIFKGSTKPMRKTFIVLAKYILPLATIAIIILGIFYGGI